MRWDHLEAAILAKDFSQALALAVSGWGKRRHTILADLVDVIAARAEPADPIEARGTGPDAFHVAWMDRMKTAEAIDMDPLLSTITRSLPAQTTNYYWAQGTAGQRYRPWLQRLEALEKVPDDPRGAWILFQIARKAPWTSPFSDDIATIYDPLLEAIARISDERVLPSLRLLLEVPVASRRVARTYFTGALPDVIEAIEVNQAKQKVLDDDELARAEQMIDALGGRLLRREDLSSTATSDQRGQRDEAALLDLVIQSKRGDDDGAYEVLADFWLEHSNPRGELATLQAKADRGTATDADAKAIRSLLREHEQTWLGDLALVTTKRVWKRGVLHQVELLQNAAADQKVWEMAPMNPQVATLRSIHKGKANETHYRRFTFSPMARGLRELIVVTKAMLRDACARAEPWPSIDHLVLSFMPDKKVLASIADSASFPRLTKVTVGVTENNVTKLIPLVASFTKARPLGCIAATPVRWYGGPTPLAEWIAAASATGPFSHVPAVEVAWMGYRSDRVTARRGEAGLRLEIVCDYYARDIIPTTKQAPIEHIMLRAPERSDVRNEDPKEIAQWLRRFPTAKVEMDETWTALLARAHTSG